MGKGKRSSIGGKVVTAQKSESSALCRRVKSVGPERFGLILVDPHKSSSRVMVTDFYGERLLPGTTFVHTGPGMTALVQTVKTCLVDHALGDCVAGVELTGQYHGPVRRALRAHWDVKMIHPYIVKQLRQADSPVEKTDDIDLLAMSRAMIGGYSTEEPVLPAAYEQWRAINRLREDLVHKRTEMKAQCQEILTAILPGYAGLFDDIWDSQAALAIAAAYGCPARIRKAGFDRLRRRLERRGLRMNEPALRRILAWSEQAADPDPNWDVRRPILVRYLGLIAHVDREITWTEVDLLRRLVGMPELVLLVVRGINVVSCAGYASEQGPVSDYLNARRITGRAGLFPGRHQSSDTDRTLGLAVRGHNARLRESLMEIGRNLCQHNPHFRAWSDLRRADGWKAARRHVAVANRFVRVAYAILTDGPDFSQPCLQRPTGALCKIFRFCVERQVGDKLTAALLLQAADRLPETCRLYELQAIRRGDWRATPARPGTRHHRPTPPPIAAALRHLEQQLNPLTEATAQTTCTT